MLDKSAAYLLKLIKDANRPTLENFSPSKAREMYVASRKVLQAKAPQVASIQQLAANGPHGNIPMRLYRGLNTPSEQAPCLIYYHGGGFSVGGLESHDILCRQIANAAQCIVIAVDYRLAPEYKFPIATEDAYAAATYISQNASTLGIDVNKIAVGGDSAGGNLAAVTCIHARDNGGPSIKLQVLIYPTTDMSSITDSKKKYSEGYYLTGDTLKWFHDNYLRSKDDAKDWRASVMLTPVLNNLPPALIITAGYDPLCDEGEQFANKLIKVGVPVTIRRFPGQIHDFMTMSKLLPEAKDAVNEIAVAIKSRL
jgi:acetyl esterase